MLKIGEATLYCLKILARGLSGFSGHFGLAVVKARAFASFCAANMVVCQGSPLELKKGSTSAMTTEEVILILFWPELQIDTRASKLESILCYLFFEYVQVPIIPIVQEVPPDHLPGLANFEMLLVKAKPHVSFVMTLMTLVNARYTPPTPYRSCHRYSHIRIIR
jgi:hypothetical protein